MGRATRTLSLVIVSPGRAEALVGGGVQGVSLGAKDASLGVCALEAVGEDRTSFAGRVIEIETGLAHADPTFPLEMLPLITNITILSSHTLQTPDHTSLTYLSILIEPLLTSTLPNLVRYPMIILITVNTFRRVTMRTSDCTFYTRSLVKGIVTETFALMSLGIRFEEGSGVAGFAFGGGETLQAAGYCARLADTVNIEEAGFAETFAVADLAVCARLAVLAFFGVIALDAVLEGIATFTASVVRGEVLIGTGTFADTILEL